MDLLSRILSTVRLHAPMFSILELGGDVSVRGRSIAGVAAFHYVIEGDCRICESGREHCLAAGEFGVFPHGPDFRIETGARVAPVELLDLLVEQGFPLWSPTAAFDAPLVMQIGVAPFATRLLTGMFSLESAEAELLTGSNPAILRFGPGDTALQGWMRACLNFVIHESAQPRPGFAAVAGRALELLLTDTLRSRVLRDPPPGWPSGMADARIRRALHAIHEQPAQPWTLEKLARVAGQSRASFAAAFAAIMDETPIAYLTRWRMHLAARRLANGTESIATIAESTGYTSGFAFNRAFRAHYQVSPSAYRKAAAQRPPRHA